jgi:hypothetical protein
MTEPATESAGWLPSSLAVSLVSQWNRSTVNNLRPIVLLGILPGAAKPVLGGPVRRNRSGRYKPGRKVLSWCCPRCIHFRPHHRERIGEVQRMTTASS